MMQLKRKLKQCGIVVMISTILLLLITENKDNSYRDNKEALQLRNVRVVGNLNATSQNASIVAKPILPVTAPPHTPPIIGPETKAPRKYDLLFNAYMNSGSRFTGSLFGFRKNAFFFYEPLWKASVWEYYKTPNLACNSISDYCSNQSATSINRKIKALTVVPRNMTISKYLLDILEKIYRCDFSHFDTLIVKDIAEVASLSGPSWDAYRVCLKSWRTPKVECIKQQEDLCRKSTHKITKVLRMTVGSLEPLLQKNPNLKIVQLFRDPRAIINSRLYSRGYPARDFTKNSRALCKKMNWDFKEGKDLLKKYPDRVKLIFYEDIKSDVMMKSEQLSNFIGMDFQAAEVNLLNRVKTNNAVAGRHIKAPSSRSKDNAFWWRLSIPDSTLKIVQRECRTVLEELGLRLFNSSTDLKNLSLPTFLTPKQSFH